MNPNSKGSRKEPRRPSPETTHPKNTNDSSAFRKRQFQNPTRIAPLPPFPNNHPRNLQLAFNIGIDKSDRPSRGLTYRYDSSPRVSATQPPNRGGGGRSRTRTAAEVAGEGATGDGGCRRRGRWLASESGGAPLGQIAPLVFALRCFGFVARWIVVVVVVVVGLGQRSLRKPEVFVFVFVFFVLINNFLVE